MTKPLPRLDVFMLTWDGRPTVLVTTAYRGDGSYADVVYQQWTEHAATHITLHTHNAPVHTRVWADALWLFDGEHRRLMGRIWRAHI